MKRLFLVVYDYGQGGVWAYLSARSESEIRARFPELEVVDRPPKWMSATERGRLRRSMKFDIDKPRGFLATLAKRSASEKGPRATEA